MIERRFNRASESLLAMMLFENHNDKFSTHVEHCGQCRVECP